MIERAEQIHRREDLKRGVILLLGDEGIDHRSVLVSVAIVFIVLMRHGMILVLVAVCGMRTVAVVHQGDLLFTTAVAQPAAMQAKGLRPAHREKRDEAKGKALEAKELHDA